MPALEKLKILIFKDDEYKEPAVPGVFVTMFNPESYTLLHETDYHESERSGDKGGTQVFRRVCSKDFSLNLVFDGTGVSGLAIPVDLQVEHFLALGGIDGSKHQPPHLILNWGTLLLKCVLKSASVNYTLFNSFGVPLRAKVAAVFKGAESASLRALLTNLTSPDLTHEVVVKAGDTLPLLCKKVYGDSSFYQDVARVNNITNFRHLTEGTVLFFPPLVNE